jgi:protein SDA1
VSRPSRRWPPASLLKYIEVPVRLCPARTADEEEFRKRWRHFLSVLELQRAQPSADSKEMVSNVSFVAHVAPCFPKVVTGLPQQLSELLEEHYDALEPPLRQALLQALILLRNRNLMPALELLKLCFRLFRCRDKILRRKLTEHVVADIKMVNLKRKDVQLNRALQNYVIGMLSDASATAAKHSLHVLIQMYRRNLWRDAKTVRTRPSRGRRSPCRHARTPRRR